MKKIVGFLVVLILLIAIYLFQVNRDNYIKTHLWKYKSGSHYGDILNFNTNEGSELELITNKNIQKKVTFFSYGYELVVKDLSTGEKGYYTNKGGR